MTNSNAPENQNLAVDFLLHGLVGVDYVLHLRGEKTSRNAQIEREERIAGSLIWNCALSLKNRGARVQIVGNLIGDDSNGRVVTRENAQQNLLISTEIAATETPYRVVLQRENAPTFLLRQSEAQARDETLWRDCNTKSSTRNAEIVSGKTQSITGNSQNETTEFAPKVTSESKIENVKTKNEDTQFASAKLGFSSLKSGGENVKSQNENSEIAPTFTSAELQNENENSASSQFAAQKSSTRSAEILRETLSQARFSRTRVFCCSDELPFSSLELVEIARAAKIPICLIQTRDETEHSDESDFQIALKTLRSRAEIAWNLRDLDEEILESTHDIESENWCDERALALAEKLWSRFGNASFS